MRTKEEIKKRVSTLDNEMKTRGPYTESQRIARIAAKQALQWVLEETDSLLTYSY